MGKSVIAVECKADDEFLLISDLHFDNPKCDRKLLKKHLDQAKQRGARVMINGDFFCIMQGLTDKRHTKSDLLPQHMGSNYFDLVIQDACEFFVPYKDILLMIGYGNHETSVIKRGEHDILANFVYRMKYEHGADIQLGGYGGWVVFRVSNKSKTRKCSINMKYFHGSGGGGVVTKGVIQNNRLASQTNGADIIWQGHVHELHHHRDMIESIDHDARLGYRVLLEPLHHVRTSTYKEEYGDGSKGWHVERGAPPKPLGGYWMKLDIDMNHSPTKKNISFTQTV
jgi:hypothetical protein